MYVYADPRDKTCQIIESHDILDAIAISNGRGIIYMADDNDNNSKDSSNLSEDQVREAMNNSIAWKDGVFSDLGKALISNSNFRNYLD